MKDIRDKDMTNRELLGSIKSQLESFATKDDLKAFATKDDLKGMEHRLERKIDALRRSNTQHHLRTREEVGYLNGKLGNIQEGLKQAAGLV